MEETKEKIEQPKKDIEALKEEVKNLESLMAEPDFWQDKEEAAKIQKRYFLLRDKLKRVEESESRYDRSSAILTIQSGAGGRDAEDWAAMMSEMYQRYGAQKGFGVKILHQSFTEGGGPEGRIGIKSITMEIEGKGAYGTLKKETGVHRLVRLSPFSAKKLRHTSFASVEVLPQLKSPQEAQIKLNPQDLKIETFRASGPGGQYVNRRESAVRITHLPTGISAACQAERLQGENRRRARQVLLGKLFALRQKEKKEELKRIKGERFSPEFGNQIRNYVLHPYRLVKDLRTKIETSDVAKVLQGDLDKFIEAELKDD